MKRYLITLGATTTAGGKVISANSFQSINGVSVAVEDDAVSCPKCNSVGVIKPDGQRLSDLCNGKQVALHDDLCICKCSPPPRLISNQTLASQSIDVEYHAAQAARAVTGIAASAASGKAPATTDDMPFLLLHPETREPFKHRHYRLELAGKVIEGTTDQHGATQPLSAAERAAVTAWHVDDLTSEG
jgi:uncharacterized Zn-binding protein involved in type VI secretion